MSGVMKFWNGDEWVAVAQAAAEGEDGADGQGVPAGGSVDQVLAKASGTDFDTEWVDAAVGLSWTQEVNEDGSSYANFSTISGTWASNGTIIQQTDTGAAERFAIHSELLPGSAVIEAEVRVPSGTAGTRIIGIGFAGTAGASSDGGNRYGDRLSMILQRVEGSWSLLAYNTSLLGAATFSASATTDTWYKMRIVRTAATYDLYFDGVLITSVLGPAVMRTATNLLLYAYADCDFRNIKAWAADLNLPA